MKICWITELNLNTRHKSYRFELSDALRNQGHEVILIIQRKISEKKIINNEIITLPIIFYPIISKFVYGLTLFFYYDSKFFQPNLSPIVSSVTYFPFNRSIPAFGISWGTSFGYLPFSTPFTYA